STYRCAGYVAILGNAIDRAVILCESEKIPAELRGIDLELHSLDLEESAAEPSPAAPQSRNEPTENLSLEDYFQHFVLEHQEHMTETELARKLGISRKCLWERRQRLGIPRRRTGVGSGS